jgi:hypothetical protein
MTSTRTGRNDKGDLMKRGLIVSLVVASCLGGAMAPAAAAPPVRGCPTEAWELGPAPTGDFPGTPSADGNGDGLSCFLEVPTGSGFFTIVDNRSNGTGH